MTQSPPIPTCGASLSPIITKDTHAMAETLVAEALQSLPAQPDERMLQGRIFDTRQRLVQKLMQECQTQEKQDFSLSTESLEDVWRDALPPLLLPPIRKIAHFSAWRTALVALLGFLCGLALGQALTSLGLMADAASTAQVITASPFTSLHMGVQLFCGLMGAMGLVWLAEYLVAGMTAGRLSFGGKVYTWKKVRRLCTWGFGALLVLSLVRDFMGAKLGIVHLIQGFGFIFTSGQVLPFFANVYGILIFVVLFTLLLKRPLSFDDHDFAEKLHMAIVQWWAAASMVGALLQENMQLKNDPTKDAWKKVGLELYSLAEELPPARGQWLEERLRRLGIEATREQGILHWSEELAERYTALGHVEMGDACYVDEPPLMEQGILARKGIVRKVRK